MTGKASSINPFPGLRPFRQDEDYLFFGREEQTMELLQRLGTHRFVAVVGTSGSGKSSLVRCGLLSELQGGKLLRAGAAWEIAVTNPGGNPLLLLADSLLEAELYDGGEDDAREQLLATLRRSHFGLVEAVKQARLGEGTNFLLVVDQFEEIFRFNEAGQVQQELANEFISLLLESVAQTEVPIYVVLTMRSDFIGDCGQFEGLAELVNRGEFLIPRLTREQYKRVIEAPIKVAGGQITPRLLQRLLNDLGQQADQLPCLQHALMRTWTMWSEHGESDAIDLEEYRRVGKMSHALSLHADEVYASLAGDRQRELCAELFQALTVQESENRGIRRPQRLGRLCQILEVPASELIPIIDAYRQRGVTFLMPSPEVELHGETIIDISHESLMRVWTRLRGWVAEEAQAVGIYRRLSESAELYAQRKAGLYRDPELGIALSWRTARKRNQAWAERYHPGFAAAMEFLEQSHSAALKADEQREAARQHELHQAKELANAQRLRADEQKRAAVRLKWLVGALAGVAAMALVAFGMAATARKAAESNEALAVQSNAEAVAAADAAVIARKDAESARDEAQRAGDEERKQRQVAQTQTAAAVRAKQQLETALAQAEQARNDAEQARMQAEAAQLQSEKEQLRAETAEREAVKERKLAVTAQRRAEEDRKRAEVSQRQAEDDRKRAEAAELQAVNDRTRAEHEKLLAEKNAELARRRERLFEKLLPLLQDHASEGVLQYANRLQGEGQDSEALSTFVEFTDLTLGEQRGFLASDLLDLGSLDLEGLDSEAVEVEISVPPRSLFLQVLQPGIRLGEQLLEENNDEPTRQMVANLHASRAQLLQQHADQQWSDEVPVAQLVFESYNRAATLRPDDYKHFLGRAASRFRLAKPDLAEALSDLDRSIRLYPDPPQPARDEGGVTDRHREFAQLLDARANVLEYMAARGAGEEARGLLQQAGAAHRRAQSFDRQNLRYAVGIARTLRKQATSTPDNVRTQQLQDAEQLLDVVLQSAPELPEAHNESGEIHLAQGRLAQARQAFALAVDYGRQTGRKRSLYAYYCNLANAQTREPANGTSYRTALSAATNAVGLGIDKPADAHYYRGFALWKLGQIGEALDAFTDVLKIDAMHVSTLLARCQMVFEMKAPNEATEAQITQAYRDAKSVRDLPGLTREDKAKAEYVSSLGWLRTHIENRSERALVECQRLALNASRGSPVYLAFAKQIFDYAAGVNWQDAGLRQDSQRLRQQLQGLTGR